MRHAIAAPMILGAVPQRRNVYKASKDSPAGVETPTVIELRPLLEEWAKARRALETAYETPLTWCPPGEDRELVGHVRLVSFWPDGENFKVVLGYIGSAERFERVRDMLKKPCLLSLEVVQDVQSVALVPDVVPHFDLPASFQQMPKTRGKRLPRPR